VRNVLCQSMIELAADPAFLFFTGDLGFQALEPLRAAAGARGRMRRIWWPVQKRPKRAFDLCTLARGCDMVRHMVRLDCLQSQRPYRFPS